MKTFKAICAASVIALTLCVPAYAGDVLFPGKPAPPTGGVTNPMSTPDNTGIAGGATAVDGDISFSALADIMWALASIF